MVNHSYVSSKVKRKGKGKTRKANKKRSKIYKGGAEYYAPLGDSDRDSIDEKMESALSNFGISNTPEYKQSGWLSIGIGMLAIGGVVYVLLKKK